LRALALVALLPSLALAQAEPAPEDYVPPGRTKPLPPPEPPTHEGPEAPPKWHAAIAPHLVVRFGSVPADIPVIGYGGGVSISRALLPFGRVLRLGVGADFGYDRLPGPSTFIAHATFAAMVVVDANVGPQKRVRPWLAAGGGISAAQFRIDDPNPAKAKDIFSAAGLVKVALGFGVRVWRWLEIGLRGELDFTFASQSELTTSWFSAALELGSSF
jgi:hypothetical protein